RKVPLLADLLAELLQGLSDLAPRAAGGFEGVSGGALVGALRLEVLVSGQRAGGLFDPPLDVPRFSMDFVAVHIASSGSPGRCSFRAARRWSLRICCKVFQCYCAAVPVKDATGGLGELGDWGFWEEWEKGAPPPVTPSP